MRSSRRRARRALPAATREQAEAARDRHDRRLGRRRAHRRGPGAARSAGAAPRDAGRVLARDVGIHCALTRLSEIDNIHLAVDDHAGRIVVPAALTIAAALPGYWRERCSRPHRRRATRRWSGWASRSAGRPCSTAASGRPISRRRSAWRRWPRGFTSLDADADRACAGAGVDLRFAGRRSPQRREHVALVRHWPCRAQRSHAPRRRRRLASPRT